MSTSVLKLRLMLSINFKMRQKIKNLLAAE